MKINKCDLGIGAFYGLGLFYVMGQATVLAAIATAFVWAIGGAEKKIIRQVGCPLVVVFFSLVMFQNWWIAMAGVVSFLALTIGYSIPDANQTKASFLGTFWMNVYWRMEQQGAPISGRQDFVDAATRGSFGAIQALAWTFAAIELGAPRWSVPVSILVMALGFGASVRLLKGEIEI